MLILNGFKTKICVLGKNVGIFLSSVAPKRVVSSFKRLTNLKIRESKICMFNVWGFSPGALVSYHSPEKCTQVNWRSLYSLKVLGCLGYVGCALYVVIIVGFHKALLIL